MTQTPRTTRQYLAAAGYLAVLAFVLGGAMVGFKILFEANHIGYSPFSIVPFIAVLAAIGLANTLWPLRNRRLGILIVGLSVFALATLFLLDRHNILVEYHEWIRRGMPPKPW